MAYAAGKCLSRLGGVVHMYKGATPTRKMLTHAYAETNSQTTGPAQ